MRETGKSDGNSNSRIKKRLGKTEGYWKEYLDWTIVGESLCNEVRIKRGESRSIRNIS